MTNKKRLRADEWKNVIRNMNEANEEVEVTWLDSGDEWCLNADCELFEDGFTSEKEAQERLNFVTENFT
jgi:hypothetical protein